MLDGGIGEQTFDVAPAVKHEGAEQERDEPHADHQRPRRERLRVAGEQHLAAEQRIERDVEQQAREHGGDRRRAFGMSVGQPGMQREEADLGAIAEQQEDEGEVEHCRLERSGTGDKVGPHHGVQPCAHHRLGSHIDEDGAE